MQPPATPPRNMYLHFLDAYHLHRAYRNAHSWQHVLEEGRRAFRLALCVAARSYLPASSFFESPLARHILGAHPMAVATGKVRLTAADASLEEHREGKISQYRHDSPLQLGVAYRTPIDSAVAYEVRTGNTRRHLEQRWLSRLHRDTLLQDIDPVGHLRLTPALERAWESVPDAVGELAFVPGHVEDRLGALWRGDIRTVRPYLTGLIESSYVEMYMLALSAGVIRGLVRLGSPFPLPTYPDSLAYGPALEAVYRAGLLAQLDTPDESGFLAAAETIGHAVVEAERPAVPRTAGGPRAASIRPATRHRPRIGVVTILEEEFLAVRDQLHGRSVRAIGRDPHAYVCGRLSSRLPSGAVDVDVVLVKQLRMTNPSAATAATSLLKAFPSVRDVVLVGIAGAIPRPDTADKDIRLGDVVVSDRAGVWHTDHAAVSDGVRTARGALPPPSPRLLGALDRLVGQGDAERVIADHLAALATRDQRFARPPPETDILLGPGRRPVRRARAAAGPRLFRGVVASGNTLVRDAKERDRIGATSGALALDMESAGVAEAAWSASRQYFVVRGLSDYCDHRKNDSWHWYAAATAAATAVSIIEFSTV